MKKQLARQARSQALIKLFSLLLGTLVVLQLVLPKILYADTVSDSLNFSLSNQTMWGEEGSFNRSYTKSWNGSLSSGDYVYTVDVPPGYPCGTILDPDWCFPSGDFGFEASITSSGSVGVGVSGSFQAPTFDAENPFAIGISRPTPSTVMAGTDFSLGLTASPDDTKLTTAFEAPTFSSTFSLATKTTASADVCLWDCASPSGTLLDFDQTVNLLGFNDSMLSGSDPKITAFGLNIPFVNFDTAVDVCEPIPTYLGGKNYCPRKDGTGGISGALYATISFPDYEAAATADGTVTVNQHQEIIKLQPDLSGIPKNYFQVKIPLNMTQSLGALELGYTTFMGRFGPGVGYDQISTFTPGSLRTTFSFDQLIGRWLNPEHSAYEIIDSLILDAGQTMPELFFLHSGQNVTVTPTYSVIGSTFTNETYGTFDFVWNINFLGLTLKMPISDASGGVLDDIDIDLGPLLAWNDHLTLSRTYINGSDLDLGFDSRQGSNFALNAAITPCSQAGTISGGFIFDRFCSGTLVKEGGAAAELFQDNLHSGTILRGGLLKVDRDSNLGDANAELTFDGGTLLTRNFDTDPIGIISARPISFTGNGGTFDTNALNSTLSGAITGSGPFTKRGSGTLTLTGSYDNVGATRIAGGTLILEDDGRMNASTALTVGENTFFNIGPASGSREIGSLEGPGDVLLGLNTLTTGGNSNSSIFSGVISGDGGLTKRGSGVFTLNGTNTYSGTTTLEQGLISVSSDANLGNGGALNFDGGGLRTTSSFTTSRAITLNKGGGTFDTATAGVTLDLDMSIGGPGMLTKSGEGQLALHRSNSYSGGTMVDGGTLVLSGDGALNAVGSVEISSGTFDISPTFAGSTIGSLAGEGSVVLGSNPLTTGGNGSDTFFSGSISGTGTLTKSGDGNMILAGNNSYTGRTTITTGTLTVNGSLAGDVQNNVYGRLMGSGSIGGVVFNDGIIAPGNSIGTLSVGSYVSNASSTYEIEVDAAGNNDLIAATGTATLNGGAVNVLAPGVSSDYLRRTFYDIVNADGGVVGTYGSVISRLGTLSPLLLYDDPDLVKLILMRNDINFGSLAGARTKNQISVAGVLTTAGVTAFTGDLADVLDIFVDDLAEDDRSAALDEMGGQKIHTAMPMVAFSLIEGFQGSVGSRMSRLHQVNQGALAKVDPVDGVKLAMAGDVTDLGPIDSQRNKNRNLWVHAYGIGGDVDGDENAAGYDYDVKGLAMGIDFPVAKGLHLGVTAGYGSADVQTDLNDDGDVEGILAGVYANYENGGFYLDGMVTYADNSYETSRNISFGTLSRTAEGDYDGSEWAFAAETGYVAALGSFNVQPFFGSRFIRLDEDSFTETGAVDLNLTVEERTVHSWTVYPGIKVSHPIKTGERSFFVPELSVKWVRELRDDHDTLSAGFVGAPAAGSFRVEGVEIDDDSVEIGGGFKVLDGDAFQVGLNFTSELNSDRSSHLAEVGMKYSW